MSLLKGLLDSYFDQTTVHGFPYVHSRNACLVKLIWITVIICGFVVASIMIANMIQDWDENPTITTLDSIAAPIQNIPFPTVTVCPDDSTLPDNWALPELILNAVPFECYGDKDPSCNQTQEVRNDFRKVLLALAERIRHLIKVNGNRGLFGREEGRTFNGTETMSIFGPYLDDPTDEQKLICLITDNMALLSKVLESFIDNFAKLATGDPYEAIWKVANETIGEEMFFNNEGECCVENCDNLYRIGNGLLELGETLVGTKNPMGTMPLGRLLSNFVALAKAKTFSFDPEHRIRDLERDSPHGLCNGFNDLDKLLHGFFIDLMSKLGLEAPISMFDIPSILSLQPDLDDRGPTMISGYPYSMCQVEKNVMVSALDASCKKAWNDYYELGIAPHPCDYMEEKPVCCHYMTGKANQNLKPIMAVMRLASRRGQNLIDIEELLIPFQNKDLRYKFNPIGVGYYKHKRVYDPTAYVRSCFFAGETQRTNDGMEDCHMFEPVVTDMGICYAFNAKSMSQTLKPSKFRDAFIATYKPDMYELDQRMGVGTGKRLSLSFTLDNNAVDRQWLEKRFPFFIGIASDQGIFELKATSKLVRPGYLVEYDVHPIQAEASKDLKKLSPKQRGCQFEDETEGLVTMFRYYSQPSCQLECMIKYSRNLCRCTPWNMPTSPNANLTIICDSFGQDCFNWAMRQRQHLQNCNCPTDCNAIKYTVVEKEQELDSKLECSQNHLGSKLSVLKEHNLRNELLYTFYKLTKNGKLNKTVTDAYQELCERTMKENIAIVRVNFGSNSYVKTITDKRVTFADQLGSLGGTLGLFTGMSLLSIFEVFFWLMKGLAKILRLQQSHGNLDKNQPKILTL